MECPLLENTPSPIEWIHSIFGACIYGYQDAFSLILGYVSIFCWLNAQIPQMIENYRLRAADGLSLYLLYFWLLGDIGSLTSCFLNHQLTFQKCLGAYFVLTDIILLFQYFHYEYNRIDGDSMIVSQVKSLNASLKENYNLEMTLSNTHVSEYLYGSIGNDNITTIKNTRNKSKGLSLLAILFFSYNLQSNASLLSHFNEMEEQSSSLIDSVSASEVSQPLMTMGWILAWICTSLYFLSRIPQIYKNYKCHSVDGISIELFVFAVSGNITYALSILLHPGHTWESLMKALPYISGSIGILLLDFIIFAQLIYYRKNPRLPL
ncbi:PQ loop repeat-domain-containing protein [Pilobolus umbonatus]|nr:PQ loop repeat-domain-containing protein [Pilobolus umbonatus]